MISLNGRRWDERGFRGASPVVLARGDAEPLHQGSLQVPTVVVILAEQTILLSRTPQFIVSRSLSLSLIYLSVSCPLSPFLLTVSLSLLQFQELNARNFIQYQLDCTGLHNI